MQRIKKQSHDLNLLVDCIPMNSLHLEIIMRKIWENTIDVGVGGWVVNW